MRLLATIEFERYCPESWVSPLPIGRRRTANAGSRSTRLHAGLSGRIPIRIVDYGTGHGGILGRKIQAIELSARIQHYGKSGGQRLVPQFASHHLAAASNRPSSKGNAAIGSPASLNPVGIVIVGKPLEVHG